LKTEYADTIRATAIPIRTTTPITYLFNCLL
jgi:hypothetical protein